MDSKKTNLTPELKEIYDRVMNTQSGNKTTTPTPQPISTPPLPTPSVTNPTPSNVQQGPQMPPSVTTPSPAPIPNPPQPMQSTIPSVMSPAEEALTNSPARPISEGNTFSFSGGSQKPFTPAPTPTADSSPTKDTKKKSKISMPILLVLGLAFLVVWGVFWAIMFGFIKR